MKLFIGTSGWAYSWNEGNSLEWYVENSGLNAIELNMSFYRFPNPNVVKSWSKRGKNLAWVIKVHRSITHLKKLNKESYNIFERFQKIFEPLENSIHYYLLQLPPRFNNIDLLNSFIEGCKCEKLCVEFRNKSLFNDEIILWGKKKGILIVSIDSPEITRKIMSDRVIYERIHGRTDWYSHDYTRQDLLEIKNIILSANPDKIYVFFNNNHAMLENARAMQKLILNENI